ncbi:hypothetical protein IAU59_006483 [Kwoniella sp. CBS 9459]
MDFSSSNAPVSRDTWAPRSRSASPSRGSGAAARDAGYPADPYDDKPRDLRDRDDGARNGNGNGNGYADEGRNGGGDGYRGDGG